jgi:hypothetical protein
MWQRPPMRIEAPLARVVSSSLWATSARITRRQPLLYTDGAAPLLDRPAHVRAGSGCAWIPGTSTLAIVQDDTHIVATFDIRDDRTDGIALSARSGIRQFDKLRNNKMLKMDLESVMSLSVESTPTVVAFGSGSAPLRDVCCILRFDEPGIVDVTEVSLPELYAAFMAHPTLHGARRNIEGCAWMPDGKVVFANRGNGDADSDGRPLDALITVDGAALWRHITAGQAVPRVERVDVLCVGQIGHVDGVALTLTDLAACSDGALLFSAAAEASANAIDDGDVVGVVIGMRDVAGHIHTVAVVDQDGAPYKHKIEGVAPVPTHDGSPSNTLACVVDTDDPTVPSELLFVRLT